MVNSNALYSYGFHRARASSNGRTQWGSTITMSVPTGTTAASSSNPQYIAGGYDIAALRIDLTAAAAGTLSGPKALENAFTSIQIYDRNSEPVFSQIAGTDIPFIAKWTGKMKKLVSSTTIGNTDATDSFIIQRSLPAALGPYKVVVGFAALAALGTSGQTSYDASCTIRPIYMDGTATTCERISNVQVGAVTGAGTFQLAQFLDKSRVLNALGIYFTESKFTSFTFSRDNGQELNVITVADMTTYENELSYTGHATNQAFIEALPPFIVNPATVLNWTASASDTVNFIHFLQDPKAN